jgi:hypothetical protein
MISITKLEVLKNNKIHFVFSDRAEKTVDFTPFIGKSTLSNALLDPKYFQKVELYEHGRGIYWPNDYDFCPDFLRKYQPAEREELAAK